MPKLISATTGICPYCSQTSFQEVAVEKPRTDREVVQCTVCDRYSTRKRGKHYPHDNPQDPNALCATALMLELG